MNLIGEEEWAAFAEEADTVIREIEEALLGMERRAPNAEEINALYRGLHTLKGTSSFLSLDSFGHLAHVCEDLVSLARDHGMAVDAPMLTLLLEAVDVLRQGVERIRIESADLDAKAVEPLCQRITVAFRARRGSPAVAAPAPHEVHEVVEVALTEAEVFEVPAIEDGGDAGASAAEARPRTRDGGAAEARTEYLRIDGAKVSALMDLAGELGLACSAVTRHPDVASGDLEGFASAAHRLELLVRSIQTDLSALRLVPVAPLFQRMQRVVRDAALRTGKEVELQVVGEDTEVDKVMLDQIQDPLVHVLRNAVDHGIEDADERARLGKPACGRIVLSASHQGGEVVIGVRDDGRGVDRARVLAKARERGLCPPSAAPSDAEILDFVFLPGFSTKKEVDELSGRGVGMDVVRTTVESLRGHVHLASRQGAGSQVKMTMPLTLAFVDAMVIREGERLFALPIEKVFEVSKIERGRLVTNSADGHVLLRVRDTSVPVVWLHRFWGEKSDVGCELEGRVVVLVQTLRGAVALPVDELIGNQQVMLKPLRGLLSTIRAAAGCGMLRTGDVAIALDCDKLHD